MTQGQTVLIWGASGGIGAYACQYVLNGGGTPIGVVSSPERAALLREMGVEHVIDRKAEGYQFWKDEHTQDPTEWRRLGKRIRELVGTDPDIVFEHPGRSDDGRVGVRVHARRHDRHLRGDHRLHDRVRQPLPLDEPEDAQGLPLRELPRGVGGQPADRARAGSTRCSRRCSRSSRWPTRSARCTTTCTRASSACWCSRPRRASASPIPSCARAAPRPDHAASGGRQRRKVLDAHRDRPRRDRRQRPRGRDRATTGTSTASRSSTARWSSATAWRRRCSRSPTPTCSCSRRSATTRPWPSSWRPRARASTTSGTGSTTARPRSSGSRPRAAALIDEAPRPGSRGTTVAFVHPKGAFGTLIELVQE